MRRIESRPGPAGHPPATSGGLPRCFQGAFTHAGFYRDNLILREDGVVVLIDWENSGWYSSYWEYCSAMWDEDHWGDKISEMLNEFIPELKWMREHKAIMLQ